jgi:hypothetical protein
MDQLKVDTKAKVGIKPNFLSIIPCIRQRGAQSLMKNLLGHSRYCGINILNLLRQIVLIFFYLILFLIISILLSSCMHWSDWRKSVDWDEFGFADLPE